MKKADVQLITILSIYPDENMMQERLILDAVNFMFHYMCLC